MKLALATVALLLCISFPVQTPVPLAHGDVPGEPHHHLKIENSYVRAYYVEVAPHDSTQLHQHDLDYLYVILGPADIINAVIGKPELHQVLKDGEVHFTRGGFAHVARNLSDAPFRNVTIEFLRPQGAARNLCQKIIDGPLNKCPPSDSDSPLKAVPQLFRAKPLFETGEILATSFSLARNVNHSEQASESPRLLVVCDRSELRLDLLGEPFRSVKSGEVLWLPAGSALKITSLVAQGSSRFLLVTFKSSPVLDQAAKP